VSWRSKGKYTLFSAQKPNLHKRIYATGVSVFSRKIAEGKKIPRGADRKVISDQISAIRKQERDNAPRAARGEKALRMQSSQRRGTVTQRSQR
jgi:hypothetical protein